MSTIPKLAERQNCGDYTTIFQGLYKGYADCEKWCALKCPNDLPPQQVKRMIEECRRECRRYQAQCPAGQ